MLALLALAGVRGGAGRTPADQSQAPRTRSACGWKASSPPIKAAADPARADQIKRAQDAIAKQQADLDRTVAQAHKAGCAGKDLCAVLRLSPQCGPITSQI